MKLSPDIVNNLRSEWAGVVKMTESMRSLIILAHTSGMGSGPTAGPALRGVLHNLPLLLAFDVLKQTLAEARDGGLFECSGNSLGKLMKRAKDVLPWIDWQEMWDGVERRNEVAHDGMLFDGRQCMEDIDRVGAQLAAWEIIDTP